MNRRVFLERLLAAAALASVPKKFYFDYGANSYYRRDIRFENPIDPFDKFGPYYTSQHDLDLLVSMYTYNVKWVGMYICLPDTKVWTPTVSLSNS